MLECLKVNPESLQNGNRRIDEHHNRAALLLHCPDRWLSCALQLRKSVRGARPSGLRCIPTQAIAVQQLEGSDEAADMGIEETRAEPTADPKLQFARRCAD